MLVPPAVLPWFDPLLDALDSLEPLLDALARLDPLLLDALDSLEPLLDALDSLEPLLDALARLDPLLLDALDSLEPLLDALDSLEPLLDALARLDPLLLDALDSLEPLLDALDSPVCPDPLPALEPSTSPVSSGLLAPSEPPALGFPSGLAGVPAEAEPSDFSGSFTAPGLPAVVVLSPPLRICTSLPAGDFLDSPRFCSVCSADMLQWVKRGTRSPTTYAFGNKDWFNANPLVQGIAI